MTDIANPRRIEIPLEQVDRIAVGFPAMPVPVREVAAYGAADMPPDTGRGAARPACGLDDQPRLPAVRLAEALNVQPIRAASSNKAEACELKL